MRFFKTFISFILPELQPVGFRNAVSTVECEKVLYLVSLLSICGFSVMLRSCIDVSLQLEGSSA